MYYIMREGCIRLRLPSSPSCGWPSPGMRKCRKVQQARGRGAIRAYRVTWSWEISRRGGFSEEDLYITREEDLARRIGQTSIYAQKIELELLTAQDAISSLLLQRLV